MISDFIAVKSNIAKKRAKAKTNNRQKSTEVKTSALFQYGSPCPYHYGKISLISTGVL